MPIYNPKDPSLDLDTLSITRKKLKSYMELNLGIRVREEHFNDECYWIPEGVNKIRETAVQARLTRKDGTKFNKSFAVSSYLEYSDPLAQAIIEAAEAILEARSESSLSRSKRVLPKVGFLLGKKSHQIPLVKLTISHMIDGNLIDHGSISQSITSFSFVEFLQAYIDGHDSLLSALALSKTNAQMNNFEAKYRIEPNELILKFAESFDEALKRFEDRVFEDYPEGEHPSLSEISEISGIEYKDEPSYIYIAGLNTSPSRVLQKSEFAGFESYNFASRIAAIALWFVKETPEKTYTPPRRLTTSPHPTSGIVGISVSVDNRRRSLIINAHLRYRGPGKGNDKRVFYVSKYGLEEAFKRAVNISRKYFFEDPLTRSQFQDWYFKFRCYILPRLPDEMIKTVNDELKGISVISPVNPTMIGARRTTEIKRTRTKKRRSK
ncbi:hypothetical protein [Vibrio harveyi]|uniref:hypothetical protein n=1 Tax=Vibrio harveyi TaxID=669 RepID=UPI003CE82D59